MRPAGETGLRSAAVLGSFGRGRQASARPAGEGDVAGGVETEEAKEHFVGREGEDVLFSTDFCSAPKTTKHLFL